MKLLNDFADESKRKKALKDLNLVINNFGEIASVFLSLVKRTSLVQGK